MADKIQKFLAKLSNKQYKEVKYLLNRIIIHDLEGLDCKPLKGYKGIYRLRKGRTRIIFRLSSTGSVKFLHIANRDDQTYRDF